MAQDRVEDTEVKCQKCKDELKDNDQLKAIEYLKKFGCGRLEAFCDDCFSSLFPEIDQIKKRKLKIQMRDEK